MSESVAPDVGTMTKLLRASAEAAVVIHGPPSIPKDSEIVGFCAVSDTVARPGQYDWIVNDFMAWKSAFEDISENQVCALPENSTKHIANITCAVLVQYD